MAAARHLSRSLALPASVVGQLSVVSYNLLAPAFVRVPNQPWNAFAHCSEDVLAWETRKTKVLATLLQANADVVCCQEVEFEEGPEGKWLIPKWLLEPMTLAGYEPVAQDFKAKEWEKLACRNDKVIGRRTCIVLATFFKKDKFEAAAPPSHGSRVFVTYLKEVGSAHEFAVANCHLEGNQEKTEQQEKQLASAVKRACTRAGAHVVVAGDFNAGQDRVLSMLPAVAAGTSAEGKLCLAETGLSWAEPGTADALDHLIYSSSLSFDATYEDMPEDVRREGLPTAEWGSDHLPIGGVFTVAAS